MPRRRTVALLAAALVAGPAACSAESADTLTVLAAASLRTPFDAIVADYERDHPGTTVRVSYAGSADLAAQVREGAPADVLATADEVTMAGVVDAGLAETPEVFATNSMAVVTPEGNPAGVESLTDLAKGDLDLVVCAPQVPCGAAALRVAEAAGFPLRPVSEENKVTDVLAKVRAGEADAGIVYVSDAAQGGVDTISIPPEHNTTTRYPVARLTGSEHVQAADELVAATVADGTGRGAGHLEAAGFGAP